MFKACPLKSSTHMLSHGWLFVAPWTVCSPLGFSVHRIFQARILGWVAISSSRGSSWPRDWAHISCTDRWILYHCVTWEAQSCQQDPPNSQSSWLLTKGTSEHMSIAHNQATGPIHFKARYEAFCSTETHGDKRYWSWIAGWTVALRSFWCPQPEPGGGARATLLLFPLIQETW